MSTKEKLEKDYQNYNLNIERMAEEEIKKIREKANLIREEASETGKSVELSINEGELALKKKVNT
jgi:hypothetical protein